MLDDEPARGLRQGAHTAGARELIPPEPANRLPAAAKTHWRVLAGLVAVPVLGVAFGLLGPYAVGLLLLAAAAIVVLPELRWRRWRYEIRDDEIDLLRGILIVRRTIVPIRRVQHVDTSVGPLQGAFGLASVEFHTAAGATEIADLARAEADRVRARVAELARTRDDV